MKKLIYFFISVLILASCSQGQSVNGNVPVTQTAAVQASPAPTSVLSCPSPSQVFVSCKEGEKVSEYFYTGDLERFFTMSSDDLSKELGSKYNETPDGFIYSVDYSGLDVSFVYGVKADGGPIDYDTSPLHRISMSDFGFRGLNKTSSLDDVIRTLGNKELFTLYHDNELNYALLYVIDNFRFVFSSPDEKCTDGLTLTITPLSQPFYISCKEGESISKTLTTGDIKLFLRLNPEDMGKQIGYGRLGGDEDTGTYDVYYEYLDLGFSYNLDSTTENGQDLIWMPVLPINCVWIKDFEFKGLNNESTFKDVINKLGKKKIRKDYAQDNEYYYLQYKLYGMWFEFIAEDEQASDGLFLNICPAN